MGVPHGMAKQEPAPQANEAVNEAVHEMFRNIAEYLDGEMEVSSMDYRLLERMNLRAAEKYRDMADHADSLTIAREKMIQKYEEFVPYMEQIDQLDANVAELEKVVGQLDEYTVRLETKFKQL